MKIIVQITAMLFFSSGIFAQEWINVFRNPDASFAEKQAAFYSYFETHPKVKGSGYKQFKRWEWMMQNRLKEDGTTPTLNELWPEMQKVEALKMQKSVGGPWTHLGPKYVPTNFVGANGAGIGRINVVAFHPTDTNIIWAGSPSGGIWKSTDRGLTWTSNSDQFVNLGVSDIAIQDSNPNIMYIATGDRDAGDTPSYGVLKSTDGGNTWAPTGLAFALNQNLLVTAILINQDNPDILLAGTTNGIYKSTDAGANWTVMNSTKIDDMNYKPGDYNTIYATGYTGGGNWRVIKSTDGGDTWNTSHSGIPVGDMSRMRLAVTAANPEVVYVVGAGSDQSYRGVYKSTNSASSWTEMSSSPNILGYAVDALEPGGQSWYDLDIAVSPLNENTLYVGGINLWASANGGANWVCVGHWTGAASVSYVHADQHFIGFQPITNNIYNGNDGGVFMLYPGSVNWYIRSNFLAVTQFYRLGTSNLTDKNVVGGTQDNGTKNFKSQGWTRIQGGDGMEAFIDWTNDNYVYCTTQNGSLYKSVDAGGSFTGITPIDQGQALEGAWVTPYIMDYESNSLLYAGYNKVWASGNGGGNWSAISPVLTNVNDNYLQHLAVSRNGEYTILAARNFAVFKSVDYGATWVNITSNLPISGLRISYIAIDDFDSKIMYATLGGYGDGKKVFRTTNGGLTWVNISGNLPNIAVNCIETEISDNRGLYIGTEFGVWFKDNTMTEWEPFGDGLPNVQVTEIEVTEKFKKVRAATYGRGIWEADTKNDLINNLSINSFSDESQSINIYPNPNNGNFNVKYPENMELKNYSVVDIQGKILTSGSGNSGNTLTIDISKFEPGVYILNAETNKGNFKRKIIYHK